jgi:hypothetical protein
MKASSYVYAIVLLLVMLNLTGCMSYTTLQSPKTLEPGEVLIGAGAAIPTEASRPIFEVNSRVGIIRNFDVGAKLAAGNVIFLDGKYQILQDPIYISADLGWSYFSISDDIAGNFHGKSTCWYPMIIAGQDYWYVAVKKVYMSTDGEVELIGSWNFSGSGWLSTNIVAGVILGDKIRLIPEVNLIIPDHGNKSIFIPAVGLQFVF